MSLVPTILIYAFSFVSVFFQVFLIITLVEHKADERKRMDPKVRTDASKARPSVIPGYDYPSVTILVPIFNEERTVEKTIESLLELEYPKDKLSIMIVDDGSKDNSWNLVQKFRGNPQVLLHQKENGGKYTALNYGITHSTSEYIGCLDADSSVDPKALLHIMPYFDNPEFVVVTPSMKIREPNTILALVQNAEYNMGIFMRKIFSLLNAQYVVPGPFSIFRKSVFEKVGPYKHAHNTEDLEMALRLQEQHLRIANADRAIVYTVGPRTLYKLYRQRIRWTGGFLQNALDYKKMIFNPRYGNLGFFVLPIGMYTILGTLFFLFYTIYNMSVTAFDFYERTRLVGLDFSLTGLSWDQALYALQPPIFIGLAIVGMVIFAIWYGKKIAGIEDKKIIDVACFLAIYSFIAPFWVVKSVWNTIIQRDASWR